MIKYQAIKGFLNCDQEIKVNFRRSKILIPVADGSTVLIRVTIPCNCNCISELGWPLLHLRRKHFSVLMVYSILKGAPIVFSKYFQFNSLPTCSHPLTLVLPSSTINAFCYSLLWQPFLHLSEPNRNIFNSKLRHFLYKYYERC